MRQKRKVPIPKGGLGGEYEGVESEHIEASGKRPAGLFLKECVRALPNTGSVLLGPCAERLPI